jgi:hypothetical protein
MDDRNPRLKIQPLLYRHMRSFAQRQSLLLALMIGMTKKREQRSRFLIVAIR